jgi:hypothetical protein
VILPLRPSWEKINKQIKIMHTPQAIFPLLPSGENTPVLGGQGIFRRHWLRGGAGREGGREGERERGREGGREGGKEGGREGGREGEREGRSREGGREGVERE